MSKKTKQVARKESIEKAYDVIEDALRTSGVLLAENASDIQISESAIDSDKLELPDDLCDPRKTLELGRYVLENGFSFDVSNTVTSSTRYLAQAARNGKNISSEVQERMNRDRKAADK